jgi:heme exporter protein D
MEALTQFLAMGGYARFVWPAYGIAVLALTAMAVISLSAWRRQKRLWDAIAATRLDKRR